MKSDRLKACSAFALVLVFFANARAATVTNLYSTGFEGYDPRYELVGQQGWTTDFTGTGGNGLITNFYGSMAAYVGLFPLVPKAGQPKPDALTVWRPLNYSPPVTNAPIVRFTTALSIYDSTSTNRDDFSWSVYNRAGDRLFTVDFNNENLGIYYLLDGTNDWVDTGWSFENDVVYDLEISIRFDLNRWSASLGGEVIVEDQPVTTRNAQRTLGDVDAAWVIYNPNRPGDNFMVFDDYKIELVQPAVEVPPPPKLQALGRLGNGQFALRLLGANNTRYVIEASSNLVNWNPLATNTVMSGFFDFVDSTAAGQSKRFYRARWLP